MYIRSKLSSTISRGKPSSVWWVLATFLDRDNDMKGGETAHKEEARTRESDALPAPRMTINPAGMELR